MLIRCTCQGRFYFVEPLGRRSCIEKAHEDNRARSCRPCHPLFPPLGQLEGRLHGSCFTSMLQRLLCGGSPVTAVMSFPCLSTSAFFSPACGRIDAMVLLRMVPSVKKARISQGRLEGKRHGILQVRMHVRESSTSEQLILIIDLRSRRCTRRWVRPCI